MGDSFLTFFACDALRSVSMEMCFLNHLLGKQLDHVLVEMGYGVKPDEQSSKKQSMDPSEYTGSCWAGTAVRQQLLLSPTRIGGSIVRPTAENRVEFVEKHSM